MIHRYTWYLDVYALLHKKLSTPRWILFFNKRVSRRCPVFAPVDTDTFPVESSGMVPLEKKNLASSGIQVQGAGTRIQGGPVEEHAGCSQMLSLLLLLLGRELPAIV